MTNLIDPRAAARIKAAFQTFELVARTVHRRRLGRVVKPKATPTRTTMVYERGAVRLVPTRS